jgi:hypothetical protein
VNPIIRLGVAVLASVSASLLVPVPALGAMPGPHAAGSQYPHPQRPHPHRRPWPVTITVRTVPALPNVQFTFDGQPRGTDTTGRVTWTAEHNLAKHTLTLVNTSMASPDRRYRFARWSGQRDPDQAFRPTVSGLPMRANYTVTAAFAVQYPVQARFVDAQGSPVDLTSISTVKVRCDTGAVIDLPTSGTTWLDGSLPKYQRSALVTGHLSYSLQSVVMNGTNVVDAGRQRLDPGASATPTFTLQFHDLTIRARDALLHGAVGSWAELTYPDGTVRSAAFGSDHTAVVRHLPRGTYTVRVKGASGVAFAEQSTLSKDKAVDLMVVSGVDLVTLGAAISALAGGLLVVGRTWARRYLRALLGRLKRILGIAARQEAPVA